MTRITMKASDVAALGAAAEEVEAVDETGQVVGYFTTFISKDFRDRTRVARGQTDTVSSEEVWEAIRKIARERGEL